MLSLGIPYEICGDMNPRRIKAFATARDEEEKRIDSHNWSLGGYVCEAFGVVLHNAFRSKGQKAVEYSKEPRWVTKREDDIATGKIKLSKAEEAERIKEVFEQINAQLMTISPEHRDGCGKIE